MKEVKEVVHVPTRELAKEVLRVGAENGLCKNITDLDVFIKYFHKELCISFTDEICVAATHYYYEQEKYKILSAQEFLNRYKPKFRPIAMRCNQEQFDTVKDKLVGCRIVFINDFNKDPYLINNRCGEDYVITNVCNYTKDLRNRQVFEEWNEKTFLEYCGISIGVEDSHKDVHVKGCFNTDKYELEQLRKENESLKKQLKAIQDQPKVGDVCLFWDNGDFCFTTAKVVNLNKDRQYKYESSNGGVFENCIKATDENIKAKIKELQDE